MSKELSTRKPCASCPFARATPAGGTGGADPMVYVGQAWGPFLLPCHLDPKYEEDKRNPALLQCAGAAAFRANVGRAELMPPEMLHCAEDRDLVFATPVELIAHHARISLVAAQSILQDTPPSALMVIEMLKAGCQIIPRGKITDGK